MAGDPTLGPVEAAGVAVAALGELGFTALESELYVALLRESPATGYRVAQLAGKPVANTYKGLASLEAKGAVVHEDGASKTYFAIPPRELLARINRQFRSTLEQAGEALEHLGAPRIDDGVYRLSTREQVLERARQMLLQAQKVVLIVAFPEPLLLLKPDLEAAARRGVDVVAKAYRPIEIDGVEVTLSSEPDRILDNLPGEEIQLVVDGRAHLTALIRAEGVQQAIWSASPFLSFAAHNGLATEICLTQLVRVLHEGGSRKEMLTILDQIRHPADLVRQGWADLPAQR